VSAIVVTPDGWSVPRYYLGYVRFITAHPPPRPGALWYQFKLDAGSKMPWLLWSVAAVEIARGLVYGYRGHLLFGAGLLVAYLLMLLRTARDLRNRPAAVAVIDAAAPLRWAKGALTAVVPTAGGDVRLVAMPELVGDFVGEGRQAEVVFLHIPSADYCLVIAARPLPAAPSKGAGPLHNSPAAE
jgi:hypothetical protein